MSQESLDLASTIISARTSEYTQSLASFYSVGSLFEGTLVEEKDALACDFDQKITQDSRPIQSSIFGRHIPGAYEVQEQRTDGPKSDDSQPEKASYGKDEPRNSYASPMHDEIGADKYSTYTESSLTSEGRSRNLCCLVNNVGRRVFSIGGFLKKLRKPRTPPPQPSQSNYRHMSLAARQALMNEFQITLLSPSYSSHSFAEDMNLAFEQSHVENGFQKPDWPVATRNQSHYQHMDLETRQRFMNNIQDTVQGPGADLTDWKTKELALACIFDDEKVIHALLEGGATVRDTTVLNTVLLQNNFGRLSRLLTASPGRFSGWKQQRLLNACDTQNLQLIDCLLDNEVEVKLCHLKMVLQSRKLILFQRLLKSANVRLTLGQREELCKFFLQLMDQNKTFDSEKHYERLLSEISPLLGTTALVDGLLEPCDSHITIGRNTFIRACRQNDHQLVKEMLERNTLLAWCRETTECYLMFGRTALHIAAGNGAIEVADILIRHGVWVNCVYAGNRTPLHEAATNNQAAMTTLLLQKGADIHARGESRYQPIHSACMVGSYSVVKILLNSGAQIHSFGNDRFQPIHHAAQDGNNTQLIGLLVQHGADLEAKAAFGYTPLQLACKSKEGAMVETLLVLGTDPNVGDEQTPLTVACRTDEWGIVRMLLRWRADPNQGLGAKPLQVACQHSTAGVVRLLLEAGADPNVGAGEGKDEELVTPLGRAVARRCLETVSLLLKHGADVNATNASGFTALHLLALGIDGRSPVFSPLKYPDHSPASESVLRELAFRLLAAGAKVDACARDSVLEMAAKNLKTWLVAILIENGASYFRIESMKEVHKFYYSKVPEEKSAAVEILQCLQQGRQGGDGQLQRGVMERLPNGCC